MSPTNEYSGDVTLDDSEPGPVELVAPENVHIKRGAIDGDLKVVNAEYVFTNTPPSGDATIESAETVISGAIDDGYVEPDGVSGDVVIKDAEDVFIEHDAVAGDLQITGAEQQFRDESNVSVLSREKYDETVTGWQRSLHVPEPEYGIAVTGGQCTAEITDVTKDIEVYVTGWDNSVRIEGQSITVTVHVIGSHNTVEAGPYTDLEIATESGLENTFSTDAFPARELIETTKDEAYSGILVGRKKVTFQEPARDEAHCPSCGENADAVIERRQEESFFLFGHPIYQFNSGGSSYECEECALHAGPNVELTESERKDLLQ